jgi:hypothetical protein
VNGGTRGSDKVNGRYMINISDSSREYILDIRYNLTIIKGDSGIGKSAMVELVQRYNEYQKYNTDPADYSLSIKIQCSNRTEVDIIDGTSLSIWELLKLKNTIILLDERSQNINKDAIEKILKRGRAYLIIVTREIPHNINLSVNAVLTLETKKLSSGVSSSNVINAYKIKTETVPYYTYAQRETKY